MSEQLVEWAVNQATMRYVGGIIEVEQLEDEVWIALTDTWEYACTLKPHLRDVNRSDEKLMTWGSPLPVAVIHDGEIIPWHSSMDGAPPVLPEPVLPNHVVRR